MSNKSHHLIGKIYKSRFSYFDPRTRGYKFKRRPLLIVGAEKETLPCDLTVLPISKISVSSNIHDAFDIKLTKQDHENLNLTHDPSYVRTHKMTTIYSLDLIHNGEISSLKDLYPKVYEEIKEKFEGFAISLF
ncbi:hypothetical protein ACFFF5_10145 [Lederbergia wuyishanensis]|uniref:Uncharacterized protein n=1 Tax=Lederbergia wuyishanensis TaxID=1347903 RepID=A0ABU0D709_9BACI|nr:hypothetical protein [Lederbergia wuyishanensis]MCJ8008885.1 hypothetical protein [Lederbergia wuyishanensis]MDQ0344208.1 hypothetical protein [Lederbergia wuyishanensis]